MQAYDNVRNYFDTGINFTESISFSQMFGKTAIYTSLNRMDDASKIPGSELHRTNLTLRASSSFGKDDRWSVDAKVQYINSLAIIVHKVVHVMLTLFIQCLIFRPLLIYVIFPVR